ncbi:MAG: LLM class flavin-dependent oxidoreductase [Acidobacteriota bacterium]
MLSLSVLDQCPVREGSAQTEAVQESLRLAELADSLGYERYWFAEHHNSHSLACASPEVLIPAVAARTERLRVGSGGVMLSHYSSLKVAEVFRMLEALHPGRIDLGIGRAPGSDGLTAAALAHGPGALGIEHYPGQVGELLAYLGDGLPPKHPFHRVKAMPEGATRPEVWVLGSSLDSAHLAAHFGCPYSFAHFIQPAGGVEAARIYRDRFEPGAESSPRVSVGVSVQVADTEEEARFLAGSRFLWWVKILRGQPGPFPTPEEAESFDYTLSEREMMRGLHERAAIGTADQVRRRLDEIAGDYGAREVFVLTICHDPEHRLRSYELLAQSLLSSAAGEAASPSPAAAI